MIQHRSLKHFLTKSLISVTLGNDVQFLMHLFNDQSCANSSANSIKQLLNYSKNIYVKKTDRYESKTCTAIEKKGYIHGKHYPMFWYLWQAKGIYVPL